MVLLRTNPGIPPLVILRRSHPTWQPQIYKLKIINNSNQDVINLESLPMNVDTFINQKDYLGIF